MDAIRRAFQAEPAYMVSGTVGVIDAAILLAVAFGLPVTTDQKIAIDGFLMTVVSFAGYIISGAIIRSQVVPVSSLSSQARGNLP